MKLQTLVIAYGVFLIGIGIAGFASNPEKAKTALLSGGTFGLLSIGWGVLMYRGVAWPRSAALVTTAFLTLIFGWRATASWIAVAAGEPKFTAALLISAMLLASLLLLPFLLTRRTKNG